jgi:hypothetical protein
MMLDCLHHFYEVSGFFNEKFELKKQKVVGLVESGAE